MLIGGSYYSNKSRSRSRSYSSYRSRSRSSMRSRSRSSSYSRSPSPGKSNGHSYRYVEVRESDCGQLHGGTIYYTVCSSHTHTYTHTHTCTCTRTHTCAHTHTRTHTHTHTGRGPGATPHLTARVLLVVVGRTQWEATLMSTSHLKGHRLICGAERDLRRQVSTATVLHSLL